MSVSSFRFFVVVVYFCIRLLLFLLFCFFFFRVFCCDFGLFVFSFDLLLFFGVGVVAVFLCFVGWLYCGGFFVGLVLVFYVFWCVVGVGGLVPV